MPPNIDQRNPDALDAEAHELKARAERLHAEAARLRAAQRKDTGADDWIPIARSPLARKTTRALVRSGAVNAKKVGNRLYLSRASLDAYMQRDEAERATSPDDALRAELGLVRRAS